MATGTLFVVATPIGNLGDSSKRSLEVLRSVDLIACEDTRTSKTLLARHGIAVPTVSLHEHNERAQAKQLIEKLKNGKHIALVTDAGTPGLSDPGALLVEAAHRAGIPVSPLPGPSAVAAALSASGFSAEKFFFAGFLPASAAARRKALREFDFPVPVVFYEAPHRVADTLTDLASQFGEREIVIARELSKKFEEVARLPLGEAVKWIETRQHGEFVLVLSPGEPRPPTAIDAERVLDVLLESLSPSEAARLAARITGLPKRELYRKAMERQK
jgi:16S rRNA (cytidine1402-2'-O)-methyltransferase